MSKLLFWHDRSLVAARAIALPLASVLPMDFLSWIWRPLGASAATDYLCDPRLELASFGQLKRYRERARHAHGLH